MNNKPSMFELARDLERSKEKLKRAGVDITKVFIWLPDENGRLNKCGPMTADEAARRIREAYGIK